MIPNEILRKMLSSKIRKNTLFMLLEEPFSKNDIKSCLGVTSAGIDPRIKELQCNNIIYIKNGKYNLTNSGIVLAINYKRLEELINLIERTEQFLNEHDLTPIPYYLLVRLNEIGKCELIKNGIENVVATQNEFYNNLSKSSNIFAVLSTYDPAYPDFFLSMARRGVPITLIITDNILNKIQNFDPNFFPLYLKCNNTRLFSINDVKISFAVTDTFLYIALYNLNNSFDLLTSLVSHEKTALKWGEELFQYYISYSNEINLKSLIYCHI